MLIISVLLGQEWVRVSGWDSADGMEHEASAAEEDHPDQTSRAVKSKRASRDGPYLPVETFGTPV
jgi:hypothetical protein